MKQGYKLTEVGVIPEEWSTESLANLISYGPKNGYSGRSGKTARGTPTLTLTATSSGRMVLNEESVKYLEETLKINSEILLKTGDVLVQRSNTLELVGTTAIFDGPSDVYAYPDLMMRLRFKRFEVAQFFWRYANSTAGRRYFVSVAAGSTGTMPKLSGDKLRTMLIPKPTALEERAIATVLSDVDALLGGLDRLIAKKRDLKQASTQQLLTCQTRLPGFHGEWEMKTLGIVAHIKTGSRNNEDKIEDGQFPFFVRSDIVERINSYSHDCEAILVPGEGRIGEIFHYINGRFDVHQRVYAITKFQTDVSAKFLHYYLSKNFGAWAMQNTVKATVDSLRLPTFQTFEMRIPPTRTEQTAIAAVLTDLDAEIAALEARREKARALKQAMMQELLTGRTRLVNPKKSSNEESQASTDSWQTNVHFTRSVLAAEIIDRLHQQPTFGHVKFEKMLFLVERLCAVDTGSTYHRQAAGPYDNRALRSIDSQLRKQQWFDAQKEGQRYHYLPMKNRGGHKKYFERYFSGLGETFEKILDTFKTQDTERCEIVATLLAAWEDLLKGPNPVSDDRIVSEVLNNWHESKQRIPDERWRKALVWMRKENFVPRGAAKEAHA